MLDSALIRKASRLPSGRLRAPPPFARGARNRHRATILSGAAFRVHSSLGVFGFLPVPDAARQLRRCGVIVEQVPWGDGKYQSTKAHMLHLAHWARQLSWKETAETFRTSWERVRDAVE